ncbi:MAG: hypothetical protein H0V01_04665 [Bacteroidetes bacterium]|nr:hypothetical protein [Bacteroidota bacterium]HET6244854.1 alpha/beta hydrolase family protein [Bacteroidia bacterium]
MKKIYLIPGLATDERLFSNLKIKDAELKVIKWEVPLKKDTMASYAKKLAEQIDISEPFYLLGVSFGGMCAIEISKFLKPVKTVIISSAKGVDEMPFFIKMFRYFPIHKFFPEWFFIILSKTVKNTLGRHSRQDKDLLFEMLLSCPNKYIKRAINLIVSWSCQSGSCEGVNIIHIQGTSDRVIPIKNLYNAIAVPGGTHFMVLNNASFINEVINRELGN